MNTNGTCKGGQVDVSVPLSSATVRTKNPVPTLHGCSWRSTYENVITGKSVLGSAADAADIASRH